MKDQGKVIWITGLAGAGKTTLATQLCKRFRQESSSVIQLDGDNLRDLFVGGLGADTSREARLQLSFGYSKLCKLLAGQGFIVVIATVSLFKEIHKWNRSNIPVYKEVFLKVPLEELEARDQKGLYSKFHNGEITDVVGLDIEFDEPLNPDFVFKYAQEVTAADTSEILFEKLK